MMTGTWLGWNWDGGLMDLVFERERRRFRERNEKELEKVKRVSERTSWWEQHSEEALCGTDMR